MKSQKKIHYIIFSGGFTIIFLLYISIALVLFTKLVKQPAPSQTEVVPFSTPTNTISEQASISGYDTFTNNTSNLTFEFPEQWHFYDGLELSPTKTDTYWEDGVRRSSISIKISELDYVLSSGYAMRSKLITDTTLLLGDVYWRVIRLEGDPKFNVSDKHKTIMAYQTEINPSVSVLVRYREGEQSIFEPALEHLLKTVRLAR